FALIEVDDAIGDLDREAIALDLHFLAQLGLTPVVALASQAAADTLADALAPEAGAAVVAPADVHRVVHAGGIALVITPRLTDGPDPLVALAASLQSRKVILLGPRPGLIREGEVLSMVDLTCELDEVAAALDAEGGAVLARCRAVIDGAAHPITVAISSPLGLLRELFTVRGSGTLIRRGARVVRHDGLTGVDADRFVGLL